MAPIPGVRVEWPLPRGLMILIGAASAVFVVAGLRSAAGLIGPIFLALVLTIAVHPVRGYVMRRNWPGWAGTLIGLVAVYLLVLGLAAALVLAIARFATLLPEYQDDFNDLVQSGAAQLRDLGVGPAEIDGIVASFDASKLVAAAADVLTELLGLVSNLFFLLTLLLFLSIDAGHFPQQLTQLRDQRLAVVDALESFAHGTRRYLVVSTVFGFIVAVIDTTFLAFTPIPAPLLWGLLAFITNYIPNIGFVIGLVPPAMLGLLEGGPGLMVLVIVVYCVVNFLIQSVLQPRFVGEAVGLSGSITFLSLIFWAWVLGAVGALFAVPLTLLVKALLVDVDRDSAWLNPLLAGGSNHSGKEHPAVVRGERTSSDQDEAAVPGPALG
jgi:AI-2 transport protein TqsA